MVVLGKRNIEAKRTIRSLSAKLDLLNQDLDSAVREERDFQRDLDNHSQTNARTLKDFALQPTAERLPQLRDVRGEDRRGAD